MFKMNGKEFKTISEIAKVIGKGRIYRKDFEKFGIVEVKTVEDNAVEDNAVEDNAVEVKTVEVKTVEDNAVEVKTVEDNAVEVKTVEDNAVEGKFNAFEEEIKGLSVVAFKKALKKYSIKELISFVEKTGGNTWSKLDNYAIRRMRLIMELKGNYYPEYKVKASSGSPWKSIPTEKLVETANKVGAYFEDCENVGIKRMRLIMALKAFSVNPETLK